MSKHRLHASRETPFAWEIRPGMTKVAPGEDVLPTVAAASKQSTKLPPPPCPREARPVSSHLDIPLPPCPFQDYSRTTAGNQMSGGTWDNDPFLAAYIECTKRGKDPGKVAPPKRKQQRKSKGGDASHSRETLGILRCKDVMDVVVDSMVRLSHLPSSQLISRRNKVGNWMGKDPRELRSLIHERTDS